MLVAAGPAVAHHPFAAEFDAGAPLSLTGKVTQVDWEAPHVIDHGAVNDASGQARIWIFEAASPQTLEGSKFVPKPAQEFGRVVKLAPAPARPISTAASSAGLLSFEREANRRVIPQPGRRVPPS
jgi:hypothetical protein